MRGFGCVLCSTCVWVCATSFILFSSLRTMSSSIFCVTYRLVEKERKKKNALHITNATHTQAAAEAVNESLCVDVHSSLLFSYLFVFYSPPFAYKTCNTHSRHFVTGSGKSTVLSVAYTIHVCTACLPCPLILYIFCRDVAMFSLRSRSFVYLWRLYHITYLSLWHLTCVLALNWNEWP